MFKVIITLLLAVASLVSPNTWARKRYPNIYPFVPFETSEIHKKVKEVTEDDNAIINLQDIIQQNLSKADTTKTPWSGYTWAFNRGLIAYPYQYPRINFLPVFRWQAANRAYNIRRRSLRRRWRTMDADELARLAPSEKYDVLLGDDEFTLTRKVWEYIKMYGTDKKHSFVTAIDTMGGMSLEAAQALVRKGEVSNFEEGIAITQHTHQGLIEFYAKKLIEDGQAQSIREAFPQAIAKALEEAPNYVLKNIRPKNATWAGICHGWAPSSGIVDRPKHAVDIRLASGQRLRFYPDDIKALIAFSWANADIQSTRMEMRNTGEKVGGVLSAGLRCNEGKPARDEWGRYYDDKIDKYSRRQEPRCVGVHPAIWHLALVNLIGKQGRSFVTDASSKANVMNYPAKGYEFKYFDPYNGRARRTANSAIKRWEPRNDKFSRFRNPETKYLVGVTTIYHHTHDQMPGTGTTNSASDDDYTEREMFYDLELDRNYNIIGGQWRTYPVIGRRRLIRGNRNQPDFFWVIAKDAPRQYFQDHEGLTPWNNTNEVPASDWLRASNSDQFMGHTFTSNTTRCQIKHQHTGDIVSVNCTAQFLRPVPLTNVVNKLIEFSRRPLPYRR